MFDKLRSYLSEKEDFSDRDFELIESVAIQKKLRKHQYLLQEGDICKHISFIAKGLVKSYRVDDK